MVFAIDVALEIVRRNPTSEGERFKIYSQADAAVNQCFADEATTVSAAIIALQQSTTAFILLSELSVVLITLYYTWRDYRAMKSLFPNRNISIAGLLAMQGMLSCLLIGPMEQHLCDEKESSVSGTLIRFIVNPY